jgi:hypothetical protein
LVKFKIEIGGVPFWNIASCGGVHHCFSRHRHRVCHRTLRADFS